MEIGWTCIIIALSFFLSKFQSKNLTMHSALATLAFLYFRLQGWDFKCECLPNSEEFFTHAKLRGQEDGQIRTLLIFFMHKKGTCVLHA